MNDSTYRFGDCELDEHRFELRRGGVRAELQPKVLELLFALARQQDGLVSKRELLDSLWPGVAVGESSLTRLVSLARRAIGDRPGPDGLIETIAGRGYRLIAPSAVGAVSGPRSAVAVLPFADQSPEGDQQYLAEGLAEDLILRLADFDWFPVVARRSSFAHRSASSVQALGRELGAAYVVEGSVRRSGDRIRIAVQLADTATGHQVWAQRLDRQLRDVFALQDEISEAIAAALEPELWQSESEQAARRPAQNLGAWDAIQRGWWALRSGADPSRASELCARALSLDPLLAVSLYGLAASKNPESVRWLDAAGQTDAPDVARHADALSRAAAHACAGQREPMLGALEEAVQESPGRALGLRWLGLFFVAAAGPDEALLRVSEHVRALSEFAQGRYEAAAEQPATSDGASDWIIGFSVRVASLALRDEGASARELLERAHAENFEFTLAGLGPLLAAADPEVVDRLHAGLRRAGWTESI